MISRVIRSLRRRVVWLFSSPGARRHAKVGPASLWKMKREFQIDFLRKHGLEPHHTLLDIGCGTLRGGIPLIEYLNAGNYYGIEVRPEVLEEGRQELRDAKLEHKHPHLFTGARPREMATTQKFDYAWAYSVLIHMADEIAERCIADVADLLKPDGRFYANINPSEREGLGQWQGFPLVRHSRDFYIALAEKYGMTVEDLGTVESLGHRSGDPGQDGHLMLCFRRSA